MIKVAIGSKNPVKLQATEDAFRAMFADETFEFIEVDVNSGVSDQPMNDSETLQGARNRAHAAIKLTKADYGVGIEGGQSQLDDRWFTNNAAAVVSSEGQEGVSFGPRIMTPKESLEHVLKGKDLSKAIASSHGVKDIGKKEGLIGMLTKGRITRASASRDAVILGLTPFL